MKPALHRFGSSGSPVVVVDAVTGNLREIVDIAAALAPFPVSQTYYPGLRRIFDEADNAAMAYADALLEAAAPYIGGAFDAESFDLVEASFSIVTTHPTALGGPQRVPHFDSTDPNYLALLHYLGDTPDTGTAFYRQQSTGIELVTEANLPAFVEAAKADSAAMTGYINASNARYAQTGRVEAVPDRLVIYRGAQLHSGIIPPNMTISEDPRRGRLTANLFVRIKGE
ncbi:DUF6445 family protein [Sphingomonas sp. LT1P40]|uniref:DUF6445 family protein n=1 Tax=Alteristakelama amylovorans TaxID=3096166 RepID=UPI002FCC715D